MTSRSTKMEATAASGCTSTSDVIANDGQLVVGNQTTSALKEPESRSSKRTAQWSRRSIIAAMIGTAFALGLGLGLGLKAPPVVVTIVPLAFLVFLLLILAERD